MSDFSFTTRIQTVADTPIVRVPHEVSAKFPSRGLVMVEGTINGVSFQSPFEPDGEKGHWLNLSDTQLANAATGSDVSFDISVSNNWPEPIIPKDVQTALDADTDARDVWADITIMSRWDWIRWVNGTKNDATRARRIDVMCSKLRDGKRRACCFNRTECTDQSVSKSGILLA